MPLTLGKNGRQNLSFCQMFWIVQFLTRFILYSKHTNWLWMLIVDLVFEILIPFKFYLVYYCHKGIVKSCEVICFTSMWVKTIKLCGGCWAPPLDGNRVKSYVKVAHIRLFWIFLCRKESFLHAKFVHNQNWLVYVKGFQEFRVFQVDNFTVCNRKIWNIKNERSRNMYKE